MPGNQKNEKLLLPLGKLHNLKAVIESGLIWSCINRRTRFPPGAVSHELLLCWGIKMFQGSFLFLIPLLFSNFKHSKQWGKWKTLEACRLTKSVCAAATPKGSIFHVRVAFSSHYRCDVVRCGVTRRIYSTWQDTPCPLVTLLVIKTWQYLSLGNLPWNEKSRVLRAQRDPKLQFYSSFLNKQRHQQARVSSRDRNLPGTLHQCLCHCCHGDEYTSCTPIPKHMPKYTRVKVQHT